MPSQTRGRLHRQVEQAIGNIETAQRYLLKLERLYRPLHPDYADGFEAIVRGLDIMIDACWNIRNRI